jgi:pyruvate,water dikinase
VAREYGIPAVICVPDATRRITTGQIITVDGATGTVTPHEATTAAVPEPTATPSRG